MAMVQGDRRRREVAETRYVFAASTTLDEDAQAVGTKVCPRCGQELFEDMDVCYDCLYDFTRDGRSAARVQALPAAQPAQASAWPRAALSDHLLDALELDEIDDIDEMDDEPPSAPPARQPRHSRQLASADDTFDLASSVQAASAGTPGVPDKPSPAELVELVVRTSGLQVRVPVGKEGLCVGRDEANDIVIRARSVSRHHVRLATDASGVVVQDLGATNPALLGTTPLVGSMPLEPGDELRIADVTLALA